MYILLVDPTQHWPMINLIMPVDLHCFILHSMKTIHAVNNNLSSFDKTYNTGLQLNTIIMTITELCAVFFKKKIWSRNNVFHFILRESTVLVKQWLISQDITLFYIYYIHSNILFRL